MKLFISLLSLLYLSLYSLAGDVPRGFMEMDELAEAQEKAEKSGKLLALVAKGSDDN